MTEVVEASAHARAFQSIARQNALWWPALCGRNTLLRTSASSIRSRSGQVFSAAYEKEFAIGGLFLVCADTWSIFSLKCFAFQNIRPVISRKKRIFPLTFGREALCRRFVFHLFQGQPACVTGGRLPAGKRSRLRSAASSRIKCVGGRMGGLGGREPPCAPARGFPSPQQSPLTYICSAAKSARRAKREPSALSMARRFRRRAASSHMTMTPSKKASTAGRTSSSVFRAAA